jgi:hypothetical protein
MSSGDKELVFVLAMTAFLLVICGAAVVLFIRQWRREQSCKDKL